MIKLESEADLLSLSAQNVQESLTLEFKASPSLGKDDKSRSELAKDVSAFANSAGGQIIYGLKETNGGPPRGTVGPDGGVDPSNITKEWIEQVLNSTISPIVEGLRIRAIPLNNSSNVAYVLNIPQATSRAPHQAPDKKYYRRYEYNSVPMHDYEIRDIIKRTSTPDLYVRLSFEKGENQKIEFRPRDENSKTIFLFANIGNRSVQPSFYTNVDILIDAELNIVDYGSFKYIGMGNDNAGIPMHFLRRSLGIPNSFPVFKEAEAELGSPIGLSIHSRHLALAEFHLTVSIQCPGFSSEENWIVRSENAFARLRKLS